MQHSQFRYRRIYQRHFGPIPEGYEIHHRDGDFSNNQPSNLQALSVEDHYKVHRNQGDWGACWAISRRMKMSREEIAEIASRRTQQQIENGTHPFLNGKNEAKIGGHWFNNGIVEVQDRECPEGFVEGRLIRGKHQKKHVYSESQMLTCEHCGKTGLGPTMRRWHGDRCRSVKLITAPRFGDINC